MVNDITRFGPRRQGFSEDFVLGLVLGQEAKAYYYRDIAAAGMVNDRIGDIPVVVWAGDNTFHAYIRTVDGQTLTFRADGETLIDEETGTRWSVIRGTAIEGPLKGKTLEPVPNSSAYDWAWRDFYPDSEFYSAD